jgi:hypothetical protein
VLNTQSGKLLNTQSGQLDTQGGKLFATRTHHPNCKVLARSVQSELQSPYAERAGGARRASCKVLTRSVQAERAAQAAPSANSRLAARRAAMGGFTQDDSYVRGIAADAQRFTGSLFDVLLATSSRTQFSL